MRFHFIWFVLALQFGSIFSFAFAHTRAVQEQQTYTTPTKFDANRNAAEDLSVAIQEAKRSKRNILIEVGGEWCEWCHVMDAFYIEHPDLLALRDKHYVLVKVEVSERHPNSEFLSRYPRIDGFPHILILDPDGKLIHSEDTSELEDGETYSLPRFTKFLGKFAPKKRLGAGVAGLNVSAGCGRLAICFYR